MVLALCVSRQLVPCQRLQYDMELVPSLAFQVPFPLVPCTGIIRHSPHTGMLWVTVVGF